MKHPYRTGLILALAGIATRAILDVTGCTRTPDDGGDVHAQERVSVVATYDAGRFYNYGLGDWTLGHVAGVELFRGPLAVSGSLSFDRETGVFERAISCTLTKERGRLTLRGGAAVYFYPRLGRDILGSVGVSVTLR